MHFNPYGGVAAQLAVDLVNLGSDVSPAAVGGILDAHGYRPRNLVTEADAADLARWAGRLRPIFGEPDLQCQVRALNELLTVAATQIYISQHDGRPPHLHFANERAPLVDRIKAYTAGGLAHALCEERTRIGSCARTGCGVVFVDTSRNGRRRFCSTTCANRVHVADHRRRHTTSHSGH